MASRTANIFIFLSLSLFQFSFVLSGLHISKISQRKSNLLPSSSQYPACESGYYNIPGLDDSRMFYYFFEERSVNTSPIMLWLTGVPGLSSSISLFHENGPYRINEDLNLTSRRYGWDKVAKIIYVDEPIGTGLSYISDYTHMTQDWDQIIDDLYDFLQEFFLLHPGYEQNDFFITGQSYAGKYAPMLAYKIDKENKKKQSNIYIRLKGVAIGNGLTNPAKQFSEIPEFCENKGLIEKKDRPKIDAASKNCQSAIRNCDKSGNIYVCSNAYTDCGLFLENVTYYARGKSLYDYTKNRVSYLYYDFSNVARYLNLEPVKKALGAEIKPFHLLNKEVHAELSAHYMRNSEKYVANLLNLGINVLIYVGNRDILSNINGNIYWVMDLKWNGDKGFLFSKEEPFHVDDKQVGLMSGYGPLRYVEVFDAGHMVAMDQPKVAFTMIKGWMKHASRTIP